MWTPNLPFALRALPTSRLMLLLTRFRWTACRPIATPQQFVIFGSVSALDATTGDETYDIEVQVDSDTSFGSPVVIKTVRVTKLGLFVIPIVREELEAVADAAFLRLNVNVAGTTPIFNYYAYATSYQGR